MTEINAFDWLTNGLPGGQAGQPDQSQTEEGLSEQDEALQAAREAEYSERKILARWCQEGAGPAAMELLRASTVDKPLISGEGPMIEALKIGLSPAEWAFLREGQNTIYHHLLENIEWCKQFEKDLEAFAPQEGE